MRRTYTILAGHVFTTDNGETKTGGETIELDDDVADQHRHRLVLPGVPVQASATDSDEG